MNNIIDLLREQVDAIRRLADRVANLEARDTITIKTVTADPATGKLGDIIYDSNTDTVKVWAGGRWRQVD